jgi:hypothetical protein
MIVNRSILGLLPLAAALCGATSTLAEITSISGSASVAIQQFGAGGQTDTNEATKTYPGTDAVLPLQVVVRLSDEDAAGSAAAQFADPQTAAGPNPEEFAINLTLNSLVPDLYYVAQASATEVRGVLLQPADVGLAAAGQTVELRGRLFLDGVLAVFAVAEATDLTGVTISMRVTIVKEAEGSEAEQVFSGALTITGADQQQVNAAVAGGFPTRGILDADLSALDPELGVFRVFILPNLILDYAYSAVVGQPFTLRATIEVEAANQPDGVGVTAILGAPIETLQEVIEATRGAAAAKTMREAVQKERAAPTGRPTFPEPTLPWLPACGLFGIESALLLLGVVGLRAARRA